MKQELETTSRSELLGLNRRSVLKGIGGASAVGVFGLPAFTGSAVASTLEVDFDLYAITPSTPTSISGNDSPALGSVQQALVKFNPTDLSADLVANVVPGNWTDPNNSVPSIQVPTIAFDENDNLYGTAINQLTNTDSGQTGFGWLFQMNTSTGVVTLINDAPNSAFRGIWGSVFQDGNFFGLNTNNDAIYLIDPATGSATRIDDLTVPAEHTGLGLNQQTNEIWTNLGDTDVGGTGDDVYVIDVDLNTNTVTQTLLAEDVFGTGLLVAFDVSPCRGVAYTVRGGNNLIQANLLGIFSEATLGEVTYDIDGDSTDEDVLIDNIAVKQTVVCGEGCVRTPGYWKNAVRTRGGKTKLTEEEFYDECDIELGGEPVGYDDIADILNADDESSWEDKLSKHLLATKLNVCVNGSPVFVELAEKIDTADLWLDEDAMVDGMDATEEFGPYADANEEKDLVEMWKDYFDAYNNGYLAGVTSCDDLE